jgi:hypothetical protein
MIIINTPHNPVGKVFTREELEKIAVLAEEFNLLVMADEVVCILFVLLATINCLLVRLPRLRRKGTCPLCHATRHVGPHGNCVVCWQ